MTARSPRRRPRSLALAALLLAVAAPRPALAQLGLWDPAIPTRGAGAPTPPAGAPGAAPSGVHGSAGGAALFERIGEDYFATVHLYNQLSIGPVTFGVQVPLRFRVIDNDPQDEGVLRSEDWDEVSDYFKLLRFVEVTLGGEGWRFRGRYGALDSESLGHGTLVAGYRNNIDIDHYQAGLALSGAVRYGGAELLLDNLAGPEIVGLRLFVVPASFFTENVWANKLAVGVSWAADLRAPLALADATPGDGKYTAVKDSDGDLVVAGREPVHLFGFDVEYNLLRSKLVDVVPYMDVNFMKEGGTGAGLHLGTFVTIRVPSPVGPTLYTRLEYRVVGDGYVPRYVDALYEAQRVQYGPGVTARAGDPVPLTKLGWVRERGGELGTHGWLGELYLDLGGWVQLGGTFEDYQGPNNAALTLSLLFPKIRFIQVGGYYTRRGFDGLAGAFDPDGAFLVGYVRSNIWGPIALTASWTRTWRVQPDGSYEPDDSFNAGVGLSFTY